MNKILFHVFLLMILSNPLFAANGNGVSLQDAIGNAITTQNPLQVHCVSGCSGGSGSSAAGPTNAVQYNSGSSTFAGSANFFYDGTNVGIGTSVPQSALTVSGSQPTGGGGLTLTSGTLSKVALQAVSPPSSPSFALLGSNMFDNSGGTITQFDTSNRSWGLQLDTRSTVDATDFIHITTAGALSFPFKVFSDGGFGFGNSSSINSLTGDNFVMTNNNIGIGTINPGTTLDVKGTLRISGSASIGSAGQTSIDASGNISASGFTGKYNYSDGQIMTDVHNSFRMDGSTTGDFYDSNGSTGSNGQVLVSQGGGLAGVQWKTSTTGSGTVNTGTNFTIPWYNGPGTVVSPSSNFYTNGTNVGIGTFNFNNAFDVVGGVGIGTVANSNYLTMAIPSGSLVVEKNVGIGTFAPTSALQVVGNLNGDTIPTSNILGTTDTQTTTNKRVTPRVITAADATSITPNTDNATWTYQSNSQGAGTLTINADTGTPTNEQAWGLEVYASSGTQTFSWNAMFVGSTGLALPTSCTGGSDCYYSWVYNTRVSKWRYVGTGGPF